MTAATGRLRFLRTKRVGLLAIVLCLAALLVVRLTRRDLISQSTRVPGVEFNDDYWPQAAWLDDSHLFALMKGPSREMQSVRIDLKTGNRSILGTLKGLRNEGRTNSAQNFVLSPDRSHLLIPSAKVAHWELATISEMQAKRFAVTPPYWLMVNCVNPWTPDGRAVVNLTELAKDGVSVFIAESARIDKPEELKITTIKVAKLPSIAGLSYPDNLLGFGQDGSAVTTTWYPGQVVDVCMSSFPIKDRAVARMWTIKIPSDSRVDEIVLSPRGDRLLWKLRITRSSAFSRLLARLLRTQPPEENSDEIWVSRLDGSGFKKIGGVVVDLKPIRGGRGPSVEEKYPVSQLHWSPNGKMASFVHNRYCYTIAVPGD